MTVDLTPEFRDRLEKLAEKTYLGNKATVIRHALAIYEYLVTMTESGSEIVVRSPNGEERHLDRITLAVAS
jgi:predicted transcriptional regulator